MSKFLLNLQVLFLFIVFLIDCLTKLKFKGLLGIKITIELKSSSLERLIVKAEEDVHDFVFISRYVLFIIFKKLTN